MSLLKEILNSAKVKKVKRSKHEVSIDTLVIDGKKSSVYASNPKLKSNVRLVKR
jgi:SET domain-containing protein